MSGSERVANAPERTAPLLCGLPPILPADPIRALVVGSFPSVASLASGEYYGNPHNWFWRVLVSCGIVEDAQAPYGQRIEAVRAHGLAIWDLYASVRRPGSGDAAIRDAQPNRIATLYGERGPFPILLNGRRSGEWRRHFATLGVQPIALPSTSPRPRHWNTAPARAAALAEWSAALRAAGVATSCAPMR